MVCSWCLIFIRALYKNALNYKLFILILLLAVPVSRIDIFDCLTTNDQYGDECVWWTVGLESAGDKFWIESSEITLWKLRCDCILASRNFDFVACSVGVFLVFDMFRGTKSFRCFCVFRTYFHISGDSLWGETERSFYCSSFFHYFCWYCVWCRLRYEWTTREESTRYDDKSGYFFHKQRIKIYNLWRVKLYCIFVSSQ